MKTTSVFLTADDDALLERLAVREGRSRAAVIRLALEKYAREHDRPRTFHLDGNFEGDGRSIADFTEDEKDALMEGFGKA